MRNPWNLITQYHIALVFFALQALALGWFVSSHGYPRGKWVQRSLAWQGAWNQQMGQWSRLVELDALNRELLAENAKLRSSMYRTENTGREISIHSAQVVRFTWTSSANHFILNQGSKNGLKPGMGVSQNGIALGRIIEASDHFSLALPIINQEVEWSARIGSAGPVSRLLWDAHDIGRAQLQDLPRSATFSPGDSVLTSGFQGYFPAGMLIGWIADETPEFDGQFLTIGIELAADFRSLNYVEAMSIMDWESIEALSQSTPNSGS